MRDERGRVDHAAEKSDGRGQRCELLIGELHSMLTVPLISAEHARHDVISIASLPRA
jgi:hypothetical protein